MSGNRPNTASEFHVRERLHRANYPTPSELEFLAEDVIISIVPSFETTETASFIAVDLPPFQPGVLTQVPLWVGVQLKKLGRCSIKPPPWLEKDFLLQVLKLEKDLKEFQDLNPSYLEIATLLLNAAPDDIPDSSLIRTIIEDLKNVRQTKIVTGTEMTLSNLQNLEAGYIPSVVFFNSASALEINNMRPHFLTMLDTFKDYFPAEGGVFKRGANRLSSGGGGGGGGGTAGTGGAAATVRGSSGAGGPLGAKRKIRRFRSNNNTS